eukprot:TRINITY_DN13289_c0_g1_i1.p1 TRINITY_DN13289_c0_g1~~TRINITY_DN13289_c0_g1_i1.p1  ORF type:complete len:251 (+),score=32.50 TRINITY_DN13289_c0_g1_i1:28-780(+)
MRLIRTALALVLCIFACLADAKIIGWGDPAGFGQIPTFTDLVDSTQFPYTVTKAALCGTSIFILSDAGQCFVTGTVAPVATVGTTAAYSVPTVVTHPFLTTVVDIACSTGPAAGFFATNASGGVMSWGENIFGRLGNGGTLNSWSLTPQPMQNIAGAVLKVVATFDVTALWLSHGTIQVDGRCGSWCKNGIAIESTETGLLLEFSPRTVVDFAIHRANATSSIAALVCIGSGLVASSGTGLNGELMRTTF